MQHSPTSSLRNQREGNLQHWVFKHRELNMNRTGMKRDRKHEHEHEHEEMGEIRSRHRRIWGGIYLILFLAFFLTYTVSGISFIPSR